MITKKMTINIPTGLEARPVALLVQVASRYDSSIYIECGEMKVNAKSIMGMMSLGLAAGEEVNVIANGSDEQEAIENIEKYLRKTMQDSLDINLIDGDLVKENGEIIFANTGLTYFNIETTDFIKCYIFIDNNYPYELYLI